MSKDEAPSVLDSTSRKPVAESCVTGRNLQAEELWMSKDKLLSGAMSDENQQRAAQIRQVSPPTSNCCWCPSSAENGENWNKTFFSGIPGATGLYIFIDLLFWSLTG